MSLMVVVVGTDEGDIVLKFGILGGLQAFGLASYT